MRSKRTVIEGVDRKAVYDQVLHVAPFLTFGQLIILDLAGEAPAYNAVLLCDDTYGEIRTNHSVSAHH